MRRKEVQDEVAANATRMSSFSSIRTSAGGLFEMPKSDHIYVGSRAKTNPQTPINTWVDEYFDARNLVHGMAIRVIRKTVVAVMYKGISCSILTQNFPPRVKSATLSAERLAGPNQPRMNRSTPIHGPRKPIKPHAKDKLDSTPPPLSVLP